MTGLFAADVSVLEDERLYQLAYSLVTEERRRKVDAFRFQKDRRLCLGAELLLRAALRKQFDMTELPEVLPGSQEKPYFADPAAPRFSLSHSGTWVLCAVSDREVGCDVETVSPIDLKLAERFYTAGEYETIMREPEEERQKTLFRFWTLKESFLKVTGLGLSGLPLNAFEITLGTPPTVRQSVDEAGYFFREYETIPGCCCALCVRNEEAGAELRFCSLREELEREKEKKS